METYVLTFTTKKLRKKSNYPFYFKKEIGIEFSPCWAFCQFRTFEFLKYFSRFVGIESPSRFQ